MVQPRRRNNNNKSNWKFFKKTNWKMLPKTQGFLIYPRKNYRYLNKHLPSIQKNWKLRVISRNFWTKIHRRFVQLLDRIKISKKFKSKYFNKKWNIFKVKNALITKALWKLRVFLKREHKLWKLRKLYKFPKLYKYDKTRRIFAYWVIEFFIKISTYDRVTKPTPYNYKALRAIRRSLNRKLNWRINIYVGNNILYERELRRVFKLKNKRTKKLLILKSRKKKRNLSLNKEISLNLIISKVIFIGGPSEKTNVTFFSLLLFSKNNIDIFRIQLIRSRILALHAAFHWMHSARMTLLYYRNFKFMFATINPAFAKLVRWAANETFGLYSANRWLSGKLSGVIKIKYLPHYLFIPDIDDNVLIVREALKQNIALIAAINTDSTYNVDLPIFGNCKEFKFIVKITRCLVNFSKQKQAVINSSKEFLFLKRQWFNAYAFPKKVKINLKLK